MPRVMEIVTPLGEDVLLFHGMSAREEMSRLFEYQLDLLSDEGRHQPRRHPRQERHDQARAARRPDAVLQRLRHPLRAGRHARPLSSLRRHRPSLALVPDAHRRLPDLPGDDGSGHPQGGLRGSSVGRLQARADRHLPQVDLLRAVPRDRLQLRQPADGAGRHLLLLPAHRRAPHAGADRFDEQAHAASGLREAVLRRADRAGASRSSSTSARWDFAREIQPGVYVHDDYDLERPSVELKTSKTLPRGYHAERLRGLRLSRATTCRSRTASSTRRSASTSSARSSRSRRRRPTRAG